MYKLESQAKTYSTKFKLCTELLQTENIFSCPNLCKFLLLMCKKLLRKVEQFGSAKNQFPTNIAVTLVNSLWQSSSNWGTLRQ